MAKQVALTVLTVLMIVASVDDLFAQRGGGRRSGGGGRRRGGRRTTSVQRVEQQPLNVQRSEGRQSRTGLYVPNTPRAPVMPSGILGSVPPPTSSVPLTRIPASRTTSDSETQVDKPRRRTSPRPYIHVWRDITGQYSIRGNLAAFEDGVLWIRRDDGLISKIQLNQLSSADQNYVATFSTGRSAGFK